MVVEGFRELNFRQGPFAPSRQWIEHKGQIIKSSILAGLVLILLVTGYLIESRFRENKLKHLNNQIVDIFQSTLPDVTRIVDPVHQLRVAVEETRKNTFYPETNKQVRIIDILADLSRLTPDSMDVIFTRMVVGENDMMISGKTDSFKAVDDMKNFLEQSSLFKKVTISSTTTEKSGKRISFKLKIIL
jgi:Tfp pilus assembly protein PilN